MKRVAIFVSHKVRPHREAAVQIKRRLESRAERLDVYVCEAIAAGEHWDRWINDHVSQAHVLLVLWPRAEPETSWIEQEIARFTSASPQGRVIGLKYPDDPVPHPLREVQVVDASPDGIRRRLLEPLFLESTLTQLDPPLNRRVHSRELEHDAHAIAAALWEGIGTRVVSYADRLVVETSHADLLSQSDLASVPVRAPGGCTRILDWDRQAFLWRDLQGRAREAVGKGTFWVQELEHVMRDVARGGSSCVTTSTFRGRGDHAGRIFRPHLDHVEKAGDRPIRFHFVFHEVLVPEVVRGPGAIGEVFQLIYLATRVRWEVLNPFLVRHGLGEGVPPSDWNIPADERRGLVARIIGSLAIINEEAERQDIFSSLATDAFAAEDRAAVAAMLRERRAIHDAVLRAAERDDFDGLVGALGRALELNCQAMERLVPQFERLVREDCHQMRGLLRAWTPNSGSGPTTGVSDGTPSDGTP
jgi:hypothetical protein